MVEDWPLAVCDARTATIADLVEFEFITDEFVRLSYLAKWNNKVPFPLSQPDDYLLIKGFTLSRYSTLLFLRTMIIVGKPVSLRLLRNKIAKFSTKGFSIY